MPGTCPGRGDQLDRLVGQEVAPFRVVEPDVVQRRLDEQQVHPAHRLDDRLRRPGIAGISQSSAVGRLDDDAPGRDVVAAAHEPDAQIADVERAVGVVFDRIEGGVEERDPLRDGARQGIEPGATARRQVDRERVRRTLAPRVQVSQPDEVEVVVGVHVADHDGVEIVRVEHPLQVADHALADVEQERGRVPFHEISRRRRVGMGGGRRAAEHGEPQARSDRSRHGEMLGARSVACAMRTTAGLSAFRQTYDAVMLVGRPILESLSSIAFFGGLDPEALERLAAGMRARRFRRGEVIFHLGDPGDALFVIVSGEVKISLPSETGDEAILATLRPGDVFGELALLDGAPRSASATAMTAAETVVLPRDKFRELIATEAGVRDALLASIAGELRRLTTHVEELHFLDITGRLAARLVRLAHDGGTPTADGGIRLRSNLTQADLAAMVGCTRQSVNKLLGQFTDSGFVRLERDGIVVTDLDGLTAAARR